MFRLLDHLSAKFRQTLETWNKQKGKNIMVSLLMIMIILYSEIMGHVVMCTSLPHLQTTLPYFPMRHPLKELVMSSKKLDRWTQKDSRVQFKALYEQVVHFLWLTVRVYTLPRLNMPPYINAIGTLVEALWRTWLHFFKKWKLLIDLSKFLWAI